MIADHETNVVFVADTLEPRFPEVFQGLREILADHGVPFGVIPGTRDIWCRDYMPIQVRNDRFVQFRYAPDYLSGRYRHLRSDGKIGLTLPWVQNCVQSEIVLDGGNVVKWSNTAIMTEKIFAENPGWSPRRLLAELERLLEVEAIVLIPPEPEDVTGHADGVVRFVDGKAVVVNDYRGIDGLYRREVLQRLIRARLDVVEVPYRPEPPTLESEGMPSAVGNFVNFLQVGPALIVPSYGLADDERVRRILATAFPNCSMEELASRELARFGGVLNCCTWSLSK